MIRIITDSAADFEPRELEKLNITCTPLTVMFGDAEYQENISLSKAQFYDLLLNNEHNPKTSQPSPQLLMDLFEQAHESGDEAIYISISSAISGTYQSAIMTKNLLGYDTCHVVDSRNAAEKHLTAGGIELDKAAHIVTIDGTPVELSFKEFELLQYFMENSGIALSRERILNSVWNYDYYGDARTIDTHVKKLRSKLGEKAEFIRTVWGIGYKFEV